LKVWFLKQQDKRLFVNIVMPEKQRPCFAVFIYFVINNRFKSFSLFGLIAVGPADASFTGIKTVFLKTAAAASVVLFK